MYHFVCLFVFIYHDAIGNLCHILLHTTRWIFWQFLYCHELRRRNPELWVQWGYQWDCVRVCVCVCVSVCQCACIHLCCFSCCCSLGFDSHNSLDFLGGMRAAVNLWNAQYPCAGQLLMVQPTSLWPVGPWANELRDFLWFSYLVQCNLNTIRQW